MRDRTVKTLREQILAYEPEDEMEQTSKTQLLQQWDVLGQEFFRRPEQGHVTVSSLILNEQQTAMLMVYHNIYQSWSWTGGHGDGAEDLLQKAIEEAQEETGIEKVLPVSSEIISIDVLPVQAHSKNGKEIKGHIHYNITYGLLASDKEPLMVNADENSKVSWIPLSQWQQYCSESHMIPVYEKILLRIKQILQRRQEILARLPDNLLPWYAQYARILPWRQTRDPYYVWLSEIMLQQTRVEAVKGYYQRFLEQLPDIASLAEASEELLLKLWEGLGYYSRVRNMQKAAKIIMTEYHGVFPSEYQAIRALPGIGDYTAGAIASICFGLSTPAVDGNVLRVCSRITENFADVLENRTKKELQERLAAIYPAGAQAHLFNQSLMELGATICVPNGTPKCMLCPMQQWCLAYANDTRAQLPRKKLRKKRRVEEKTIFILRCKEYMALEKRPSDGLLAALWQFPNVEGCLDTQQALNQATSWGVNPCNVEEVRTGKHIFTHVEWHMTCYIIQCRSENALFVWADKENLQRTIALPTAFRQFCI